MMGTIKRNEGIPLIRPNFLVARRCIQREREREGGGGGGGRQRARERRRISISIDSLLVWATAQHPLAQ